MRIIYNKYFKVIKTCLIAILFLPIMNYVIKAVFSLGKIVGTFIRILGTM